MRHSEFREWARAELGDSRQIYAREADAPLYHPLVFMPDDAAQEFREAAKSGALICPVPGCSSPNLTTRGSHDRRDHFVHLKAPADPEHRRTYTRLATQRLLYDWVTDQDHVIDVGEGIGEAGVAILLFVRLKDWSRVALCYVDSKLGADAWEEQNDFLRSEDIAASWIFAPRKMYFAPPDTAEPVVEDQGRTDLILDQPIYKRMRKNGSWPLLINLERGKLANVIKPGGKPAKRLRFAPPVSNRVQHVAAYGLAECRLCPYGISTPGIGENTLKAGRDNWRR